MRTVELFLIGGTSQTVEGNVVLELFGRSREGVATVARYYDFRPYFVLTEPTAEVRERLSKDSEIIGQEEITTWVAGVNRPAIRVTLHSPWKVPDYRKAYHRPDDETSVLAADIPFVHRFLYDKHLGLTIAFEAEEEPEEVRARSSVPSVLRIVTTQGDIRPAEAFRPSLRILSFDIENAIRERTIFCICGVVEGGGGERRTFRLSDPSERRILEEFARIVIEEDPDVITGYNIGGYDFPLLLERSKELRLPGFFLGRKHTEPEATGGGDRLWKITGRVVADAWWSARRELRPKQETLQYVARTLLGDSKLDVDRRNISAEWAKDPARVMEYCRARRGPRAPDPGSPAVDREGGGPRDRRTPPARRRTERADVALHRRDPDPARGRGARRRAVDAPRGPRRPDRGRVRPRDPAGIYRWVVVLDFKSMYPSIIISHNLCFTTLSPEGTIVAPSGAHFLAPEVRKGIVPKILSDLLADRDRFRQLGRAATTRSSARTYDGLQNAVKVLMNSFYGVLASSFYRFTNKDIGSAITAFAREAITGIIKDLETDGHEVVYSDTDSVFVRSPVPSVEGAREFGESVAKRFTHEGVTFEFQAVYETFFSHGAKKRYVARTAWPNQELVIRGTRRGERTPSTISRKRSSRSSTS